LRSSVAHEHGFVRRIMVMAVRRGGNKCAAAG